MSDAEALLLASGSPRRREMLERLGIAVVVRPLEVDETVGDDEAPFAYLERVVAEKRAAALALLGASPSLGRCSGLLVADTMVVADRILGKPTSAREAEAMITALAGGVHLVATRFCIARLDDPTRETSRTVETRVWFRDLSAAQVRAYVKSGEGRDKAGGYGIQGIGAMLVRRIEGSYTNVVGLPLCEVVEALEALGLLRAWPLPEES